MATAALINGANIKPQRAAMPLFKHDALMANPELEHRTVRTVLSYDWLYIYSSLIIQVIFIN